MSPAALLVVVGLVTIGLVFGYRTYSELRDLRSSARNLLDRCASDLSLGMPGDGPVAVQLNSLATALVDRNARYRSDRELNARMADALDALGLGVVIVDVDGRVLLRNRVADALSQLRREDVLVPTRLDSLFSAALAGHSGEEILELHGPPARTLVLTAQPVFERDNDGQIAGALGLIEDQTERLRLESVRRDFVANISHELRTPIGALGLLAEAIADADDPDTAARLADHMGDEVERLTRTIEDLLELSKIEGGGQRETTVVSVKSVVAEAVARARPVAEGEGMQLVVVPGSEHLEVRGDSRQLVSALFNLLDNAVKYSEPENSIEVRTGREGPDVLISVTDHGIGIPAADIGRVFERFYRVDAARSRATGGTGLGLAIVRHVAVNHGGDVQVRSRAGEGSTFSLRLPAAHGDTTVAEVG